MATELKEFEKRALQLTVKERAVLAEHLIASLDEVDGAEAERLWVEEAERRYQEYKAGRTPSRPADEAIRDARASLG